MYDSPSDGGGLAASAKGLRTEAQRPSAHPPALTWLRWIALVGTVVVLVWQTTSLSDLKPRQEWGFLVSVVAGLAVAVVLRLMLPAAAGVLLRHLDLLLPLGLFISAEALLGALALIPVASALLTPAWPLRVAGLTFTLSLFWAVQVLLSIVYAGWTTMLILQAVREDRVEPLRGLSEIGRWFWRVLLVALLGWGVLFAMVAIAILFSPAAVFLALILIGAGSLAWNLATAALLLIVVGERRPLGEAIQHGLSISWLNVRRWWPAILIQMILLGWITLIHVSYSSSPRPGSVTMHNKTNWGVNGFWTGGYESNCRWYSKLMETVETPTLALVNTLLAILFGVLAIAVKLTIAQDAVHRVTVDEAPHPP